MRWDEVIMGSLAMIMGVILLFMRREILGFAREGGRGLRDRRVIVMLLSAGIVFLLAGGVAIIITRGV
jgi:hypothetical protein